MLRKQYIRTCKSLHFCYCLRLSLTPLKPVIYQSYICTVSLHMKSFYKWSPVGLWASCSGFTRFQKTGNQSLVLKSGQVTIFKGFINAVQEKSSLVVLIHFKNSGLLTVKSWRFSFVTFMQSCIQLLTCYMVLHGLLFIKCQ